MEDLSAFSAKPRLRLLLDHFAKIKDTRQACKVAYPLREVLFLASLSGSLPLMMPGGSNHRCRDFYTWELRRGQPIQERS